MEAIRVQGVLVRIDNTGVLIRGPSGIGKSGVALQLLERGHFFVSDDLVEIWEGPEGSLTGSAIEESPRIEIRGLGVFRAEILFPGGIIPSTRLDLVVDLDRYHPSTDAGRIDPEVEKARFLGLQVPRVRIPLASGADPALLVILLVRHMRHTGMVNG